MAILESVLASLAGKAPYDLCRMERENSQAMGALRRTAAALVAFAIVIAVLDIASAETRPSAEHAPPAIAAK